MDCARIIDSPDRSLTDFLDLWRDGSATIEAFTSGSTGMPKPIELAKADMRRSALATCHHFGLGHDSVLGLVLDLDHIAGRMVAVRAEMCGGQIYAEKPSLHPLADMPGDIIIDLLSIVPAQVDGLLESAAVGRVRAILVGGAPLDAKREARLVRQATIASYATYGMTETCSNVALRRLGQPVYVANEGFTFDVDRRGCLVVRSDTMSFGEVVTNDVVRLFDSTHFIWSGRIDNVINSGAVKIHPEEIEKILESVLSPQTFYVTSRPSLRWGREMVIVHEVPLPDSVKAEAEALLPHFERPKAWIKVDALERTSNGKLKRRSF